MGADLFGSFAESTCAALVVAATSEEILGAEGSIIFPLMITASGIFVSIVTSFFATNFMKVDTDDKIEKTLKYQLVISTVILTPVIYIVSLWVLPETFSIGTKDDQIETSSFKAFVCIVSGLWAGLIVGFVTEYFTSHSYKPVREVAEACRTGAATDIIYGLALGYMLSLIHTDAADE